MIRIEHQGSFKNTERFGRSALAMDYRRILHIFGQAGVRALAAATPKDTGATASGWGYRMTISSRRLRLTWFNEHTTGQTPIVILIQYGHGTRQGGYVQGRDFINPAIRPIFDGLAEAIWWEVKRL